MIQVKVEQSHHQQKEAMCACVCLCVRACAPVCVCVRARARVRACVLAARVREAITLRRSPESRGASDTQTRQLPASTSTDHPSTRPPPLTTLNPANGTPCTLTLFRHPRRQRVPGARIQLKRGVETESFQACVEGRKVEAALLFHVEG